MSEWLSNPSIAELNDEFRRTTPHPLLTPGIYERDDALAIVMRVRTFDDFTPDNDPWGEHDFGAFDWQDIGVLWKIDYPDPDTGEFQDPAGKDTNRVLTITTG